MISTPEASHQGAGRWSWKSSSRAVAARARPWRAEWLRVAERLFDAKMVFASVTLPCMGSSLPDAIMAVPVAGMPSLKAGLFPIAVREISLIQ